jgi:glutamate-1-semialdehyde 2,1-aminomutase
MVAPSGAVYQAGTLSGIRWRWRRVLKLANHRRIAGFYERLEENALVWKTEYKVACGFAVEFNFQSVGSMLTLFFTDREVVDFETAKTSDTEKFARYFNSMLENGVYLPPSQYEAWFVSIAHSNEDLDLTIEQSRQALERIFDIDKSRFVFRSSK